MCAVEFYSILPVKFTFDKKILQRVRLALNSNLVSCCSIEIFSPLLLSHYVFPVLAKRLENFDLEVIHISRFLCDIPILFPIGVFERGMSHIVLKCPEEMTQQM
jgi:hypothetical protein